MAVKQIEIMAPAGSYESLMAGIKAGADSIYFGVAQLNMRARAADNFSLEDLRKIASICRENGVKSYLTLNTILYDHDMSMMRKICDAAKESGISAVIVSDIAGMMYAKSIGLEVHISTQSNVSNFEAVKFYSQFADVVVLARELTLTQIRKIVEQIDEEDVRGPSGEKVRIELFAHGAMCVAISGKCYMSLATYNASANRGACLQNCRRSYKVTDNETGEELVIDNEYVMSPKDMCTIGFIDKMIDAGATVLKIEGRGRSPDYVYTTTKCYREAVDAYYAGTYSEDKVKAWKDELSSVYNRGFWDGYYLGKKVDAWSGTYGSQATTEKVYVGKVINYFPKPKVAHFVIETGKVEEGDELLVTGPTTGLVKMQASGIKIDDKEAKSASKGQEFTAKSTEILRKNDKLYVVRKVKVSRR